MIDDAAAIEQFRAELAAVLCNTYFAAVGSAMASAILSASTGEGERL